MLKLGSGWEEGEDCLEFQCFGFGDGVAGLKFGIILLTVQLYFDVRVLIFHMTEIPML